MKRISTQAYQALRDALPVIVWNKRPFEQFLRTSLRDAPELLNGLDFGGTKREVSEQLIDKLVTVEARRQDIVLQFMLEIASLESFANIEQIKDVNDREFRLTEARRAVGELKKVTRSLREQQSADEQLASRVAAEQNQARVQKQFAADLDYLKSEFLALSARTDMQRRGLALEKFLTKLFDFFDLEPRLSYVAGSEQIDGAFSFDTDVYIVEARWRQEPSSREHGDVFAAKVHYKGKNALGLFVAVNGFSSDFLGRYETQTPFITMDGADLFAVLDGRIRLDDLLRAKKRHANETGSCHFPVHKFV